MQLTNLNLKTPKTVKIGGSALGKVWALAWDNMVMVSPPETGENCYILGYCLQALAIYAQSLIYYAMPAVLVKLSSYAQYYASQLDCVICTNTQYVC